MLVPYNLKTEFMNNPIDKQYGDIQVLKENYNAMKAWVDYELAESKYHIL